MLSLSAASVSYIIVVYFTFSLFVFSFFSLFFLLKRDHFCFIPPLRTVVFLHFVFYLNCSGFFSKRESKRKLSKYFFLYAIVRALIT